MARFLNERVLHLFDQLIEEQIGQLRVECGFELERHHEIDHTRLGDVLQARTELPRRQQIVEQPPVDAFRLDQAGPHQGHIRGVAFVQRGESDDEVCLQGAGLLGVDVGLFAERHEGVVFLDVGHHVVQLFHGVAESEKLL